MNKWWNDHPDDDKKNKKKIIDVTPEKSGERDPDRESLRDATSDNDKDRKPRKLRD
jgi:hypothetical protein